MACMAISQAGTPLEAWQSSRSTSVSAVHLLVSMTMETELAFVTEMLTPVDQAIDKLEDLDQTEM